MWEVVGRVRNNHFYFRALLRHIVVHFIKRYTVMYIKNVLGRTQAEIKEKLKKALRNAKTWIAPGLRNTPQPPPNYAPDMSSMPNQTCAPPRSTAMKLIIERYTVLRIGSASRKNDYPTPAETLQGVVGERQRDDLNIQDKQNRTISVSKQYVRNPDGSLELTRPKTEKSVRLVSIPQTAVDLLIQEHNRHPDSPYLFPSPLTGEMYHPDSVVNLHKKILRDTGLGHLRFHDLWHTFATTAFQNGVDVKTVSSMLEHFDAGFTLRTYTHATR